MFQFILIFCSFQLLVVESGKFDFRVEPTRGYAWPGPQEESKGSAIFTIEFAQFKVLVTKQDCKVLRKAVSRSIKAIKILLKIVNTENGPSENMATERVTQKTDEEEREKLEGIIIELQNPCEEYPSMNMDESYDLTIGINSTLKSVSIWGAIRGLETFSQLFYITQDYKEVLIDQTHIMDFPRFPHRGLMLDTSRHYISVRSIETLLDAMAMNKMNVFHWHIVDNESFPYKSTKFPELSEKGAFQKNLVYTKQDIHRIVRYAADRAIRVIPEFDMPGHSEPLRKAHPELLAKKCRSGQGLLNPLKQVTYDFLRELLGEVQQAFPDQYFHFGGDAIHVNCWKHDEEIYNKTLHNLTVEQLHGVFMRNALPLLKPESKVIVWQDVFDRQIKLPKETLIQVWWRSWVEEMIAIASAGHRILFSSLWYLDSYHGYTFDSMYQSDPAQMVYNATKNETLRKYVMGGEACLLTPKINEANLHTTIWPRASAVAEVLWSAAHDTNVIIPIKTRSRIEEHACRMMRRRIPVEPPNGPGFCVTMHK